MVDKNGSTKVERARQTPFLLRAIWFVVLGWELTAVWIIIAWLLNLTIIGLPLGVWMIERVPQLLTLKAPRGEYVTDLRDGSTAYVAARQVFWPVRALYFLVVGWWLSLIWAVIAYLICLTLVGLPLGIWMLNQLALVTTLRR